MGQGDGSGAQGDVGKFFHGLGEKLQNNDWVNKAREQAEGLSRQAQDAAKNTDWRGLADKAQKEIRQHGVDVNGVHVDGNTIDQVKQGNWRGLANEKNLSGLARIAGAGLFPQAAAANIGADLIGGIVGRRQGLQMLDDPKELASRLQSNFDSMDGNKNGFIEGSELKDSSALRTLLSGNMGNLGAVSILDKGYSKFAALDGKDADKGISKADIDLFALGVDAEKRSSQTWSDTKSGALWGAAIGTAVGIGTCLLGSKAKAISTIGIRLGIGTAAGGIISNLYSRHEYGKASNEAQQMVDWLKNEL